MNTRKKHYVKDFLAMAFMLFLAVAMMPKTMGLKTDVQAATLSNPRIVRDAAMIETGQKVTWDCIWFGSYPQTEIVDQPSTCGCYGKVWAESKDYEVNAGLYASLRSASWNDNNDTVIDGKKYRRIYLAPDDIAFDDSSTDPYLYTWVASNPYHYFRYEPLKWRVLNVTNSNALLLADKALDSEDYNTNGNDVTWEKSTIRSWLNGYNSSANSDGTDYTDKSFLTSAFTTTERSAINTTTVINENNYFNKTNGGNNTNDKIFLLSETETYRSSKAKSYGFYIEGGSYDPSYFDEARRMKSTTYAKAKGLLSLNEKVVSGSINCIAGTCSWWMRSPGQRAFEATYVDYFGSVYEDGETTYGKGFGVCPVLNLNISNTGVWSYAGTVCSDETVAELPNTITVTASNLIMNYSGNAQFMNLGAKTKVGTKLTFASDNSNVTVNANGVVTVKAKFVGSATITIKAAKTGKYREATSKVSITVNPSKTTLSSAKNIKGKKMKVTWKKNKVGNGYQIQYSTNSKFATGNKTVTIKKNSIVSKTIAKLKKGKNYYVRVRTYKTVSGKKYYSAWGNVKKVKIKK